jgi:hypothetical protein
MARLAVFHSLPSSRLAGRPTTIYICNCRRSPQIFCILLHLCEVCEVLCLRKEKNETDSHGIGEIKIEMKTENLKRSDPPRRG